jgi:archaellum component FlaC
LFDSDISISIKEFTFTDLLSIFVSFFAIALSIAFYFKATDTSNRFYDNSYKFTKEISEILGRIEAGFGEKLKHIDEGYAGIRDRFDQIPFDANKAKKEIEAEKEEIQKKKKEQNELLENLAKRAQLAENEKQDLFRQMEKTSKELESAKSDLRRMQRNVISHESSSPSLNIRRKVLEYLVDRIQSEIPLGLEDEVSMRMLREIFSNIKDDIHPEALTDLIFTGIIDDEGELTRRGMESLLVRLRKRS